MFMKLLSVLVVGFAVALLLAGSQCYAQQGGTHASAVGGAGPLGGLGAGPEAEPGADRTPSTGKAESIPDLPKTPGELLSQNPKLAEKLQALLPPGTNLQAAAENFRNLGQFVAAAHVSRNLNIPFEELKATLMGPPSIPLGQAIRNLRPEVKSRMEAKRAQRKARREIRESLSSS